MGGEPLIVAGASMIAGPRPEFDAVVAILVGLLLGAMALFLAALNRRLLIDSSDQKLDGAAEAWLGKLGIAANVRSVLVDERRVVLFVHARDDVPHSHALGDDLKSHLEAGHRRTVAAVYWQFRAGSVAP